MPSRASPEEERPREFWVRADLPESWESRRDLVRAAVEAGAEFVVIRAEDLDRVKPLGPKGLAVVTKDEAREGALIVNMMPQAPGKAVPEKGVLVSIQSGEDQDLAVELAPKYRTLIVDCHDWRVIPLENLIAASQGTGTRLLAVVSNREEGALALGALQRGVDGLVLQPGTIQDIPETADLLLRGGSSLPLTEAEVLRLVPIGTGDRACIDTCSILEKGEGLLVGSQADGMALIHAENIETEYVEPRPFRVNAGAIHSYVLDLDGKTRYLSDLRAGDSVLIVRADGSTRIAAIGRVKIETRPLLMIELTSQGKDFKVMVQDAETIRLVEPGGEAVSVKALKEGDRVLAYLSGKARHFGMPVEEKLIER